MKSLFVSLFLVLSTMPSWATAGQCELCVVLDAKIKAIQEANQIKDEFARVENRTLVIKSAAILVQGKVSSSAKLSTAELDSVLKFIGSTAKEDDLLQVVEMIYPDYRARQKFYQSRIANLGKALQAAVIAQIKEFEKRSKGNG